MTSSTRAATQLAGPIGDRKAPAPAQSPVVPLDPLRQEMIYTGPKVAPVEVRGTIPSPTKPTEPMPAAPFDPQLQVAPPVFGAMAPGTGGRALGTRAGYSTPSQRTARIKDLITASKLQEETLASTTTSGSSRFILAQMHQKAIADSRHAEQVMAEARELMSAPIPEVETALRLTAGEGAGALIAGFLGGNPTQSANVAAAIAGDRHTREFKNKLAGYQQRQELARLDYGRASEDADFARRRAHQIEGQDYEFVTSERARLHEERGGLERALVESEEQDRVSAKAEHDRHVESIRAASASGSREAVAAARAQYSERYGEEFGGPISQAFDSMASRAEASGVFAALEKTESLSSLRALVAKFAELGVEIPAAVLNRESERVRAIDAAATREEGREDRKTDAQVEYYRSGGELRGAQVQKTQADASLQTEKAQTEQMRQEGTLKGPLSQGGKGGSKPAAPATDAGGDPTPIGALPPKGQTAYSNLGRAKSEKARVIEEMKREKERPLTTQEKIDEKMGKPSARSKKLKELEGKLRKADDEIRRNRSEVEQYGGKGYADAKANARAAALEKVRGAKGNPGQQKAIRDAFRSRWHEDL